MIVAVDKYYGIAKNGYIPWYVSEDIKLFKKITTSTLPNYTNILIMGSKTADTLNKPLSNRINFVLTTQAFDKYEQKGFVCFSNMDDCLKKCVELITQEKNIDKIFLIGGTHIYNWGLNNPNKIDKIYLSKINKNYKCDLFFNKELLYKFFTCKSSVSYENTDPCKEFHSMIWEMKENTEETAYLNILHDLYHNGHKRQTRNAITHSSFGKTLEFDLKHSFPLLTTKKMAFKSIFEELKFFLLGFTDNKILKDKNVHIWDGNTTKEFIEKCNLPYDENTLGPMYGFQWRHFNAQYQNSSTDYNGQGIDQLKYVIELLKTDPYSRRILMTTYNPEQASQGVLYPCHGISIQFYVEEINNKLYLDCLMHQRSADSFLGVPFNIASYALLVYILCNHINSTGGSINNKSLYPGKLLMVFGDMHIYSQHLDAIQIQLYRKPYMFPKLDINYNIKSFDKEGDGSIGSLNFTDIKINDYKCYDAIKAPMIA